MEVKYVGGIKKNGSQICSDCGYASGDVKDFRISSDIGEPLLVDEQCLDCWGKEQRYPDPDKL